MDWTSLLSQFGGGGKGGYTLPTGGNASVSGDPTSSARSDIGGDIYAGTYSPAAPPSQAQSTPWTLILAVGGGIALLAVILFSRKK